MKCQTSVLLLCLPLYSLFSPNSCFVLYNLTTNPSQVLLAKESWSFVVIFGECKGHKQITKLEKCCTHGMPFVLFWRHVILKSGIVQFMHRDTDGSCAHIKHVRACLCTYSHRMHLWREDGGGRGQGAVWKGVIQRLCAEHPAWMETPFRHGSALHTTDLTMYSGWSFKAKVHFYS